MKYRIEVAYNVEADNEHDARQAILHMYDEAPVAVKTVAIMNVWEK